MKFKALCIILVIINIILLSRVNYAVEYNISGKIQDYNTTEGVVGVELFFVVINMDYILLAESDENGDWDIEIKKETLPELINIIITPNGKENNLNFYPPQIIVSNNKDLINDARNKGYKGYYINQATDIIIESYIGSIPSIN